MAEEKKEYAIYRCTDKERMKTMAISMERIAEDEATEATGFDPCDWFLTPLQNEPVYIGKVAITLIEGIDDLENIFISDNMLLD